MSRHTIKLPDDVSNQARVLASASGMSFDAWVNTLVVREVVRKGVESYTEHLRADDEPSLAGPVCDDDADPESIHRKENDNRFASPG